LCPPRGERHPSLTLAGAVPGRWPRCPIRQAYPAGRDPVADENRRLKEPAGQQALIIEAPKSWPASYHADETQTGRRADHGRHAAFVCSWSGRPGQLKLFYYRPAVKRKPRCLDANLAAAINKVRQGCAEVYGYRRITVALKAMKFKVNGKKVLRHLRALGLTQPRKVKGQRWTHRHPSNRTPPTPAGRLISPVSGRGRAMLIFVPSSMPGTAISRAMSSPTAAGRWRHRRLWRWPCSTALEPKFRMVTD